jgi:putative phosphoribosyl transferase
MNMNNTEIIFQDRKDAGQKLALALKHYAKEAPIVLAMPRGGVVVAYEVATALNAPLDVIVTRKIGAPTQPEYAIGAIAPENIQIFNHEAISYGNFSETEITTIVAHEKNEMERRIKLYRGNRPPLNLKNKVAIIVDDGVATGQTALVAIRYARKLKAQKIIFACGVGAPDAIKFLEQEADEVVCLNLPEGFHAVGQWYLNFAQTTDEEVITLLNLSEKK